MEKETKPTDLAKAVLSRPRNFYVGKKLPNGQDALETWDALAEKYPELAEDTLLFFGYSTQDILSMRVLEDGSDWVWLELRTDGQPRQCYYVKTDEGWSYENGENEPEMSSALFSKWENSGDAIIDKALATHRTQFLKA